MLDIRKDKSVNEVAVEGILKELKVTSATSKAGKDYVSYSAVIGVDQEINGIPVENDIPVGGFAMKLNAEGNPNDSYSSILGLEDEMISLAAAEEPNQASWVRLGYSTLEENAWIDKKTGALKTGFKITSRYMNKIDKSKCDPSASFQLTGVVANISEEVDRDSVETGRLKIKLVVIDWKHQAHVIDIVAAEPNAVNFVQANWNKGDTVKANGIVNMSFKVIEKEIEQEFGAPIIKKIPIYNRELLLTSGSGSLDETSSYDADDIKIILAERAERHEELKKKITAKKAVQKKPDVDFNEIPF